MPDQRTWHIHHKEDALRAIRDTMIALRELQKRIMEIPAEHVDLDVYVRAVDTLEESLYITEAVEKAEAEYFKWIKGGA